jgi:hypothetical protein
VSTHHNQTHCVHDQQYWLSLPKMNWTNGVQDRKICGSSWYDVMKIETVQLRVQINTIWLMAFHQICTASLNDHPIEIELIINTLYDSLERGCSNITKWSIQWRYDESFVHSYVQLLRFNDGRMENNTNYPICPNNNNNNNDVFTFYNMSDLFLIILPTNETISEGSTFLSMVVSHIFRLNAYFITFTICTIVLIVIVSIMFVKFLTNRRYKFYCCMPEIHQTGYDDMEELGDLDGELSINLSGDDDKLTLSDIDDSNNL